MSHLRAAIILIVFGCIGYFWQTIKHNSDENSIIPSTIAYNEPDYIATDLTRTVYDKSGQRIQKLTAKKMTFFKHNHQAEFQSPLLILLSMENKGRWRISSQSGIMYNDQYLVLKKQVSAINLTLTDPIERISGEHIEIDTSNSTMYSQYPVNLYGDGIIISGSEMTADLNKEQIELKKHAKTLYRNIKP